MLRTEVPVYDGDPGRARSARPGDFAVPNASRYVEEAGVTHLMLGFNGPDYDLEPLRRLIAWRDEYLQRNPEAAAVS